MDISSKFIHATDLALKLSKTEPNPDFENIILWPEADAIVRFTMADRKYSSIAIESERHKVYAYWAPNFEPVYLDCDAEDFENFFNNIIDIESKTAIIH